MYLKNPTYKDMGDIRYSQINSITYLDLINGVIIKVNEGNLDNYGGQEQFERVQPNPGRFAGEDGKWRNIANAFSSSADGLVTTSYSDDNTVRGNSYIFNAIETFAGAGSVNFLVDNSNVPEANAMFILPFVLKSSEETAIIRVYEDTDYTGGTSVTPRNANRNFTDTPNFVVTTGATGSDKGTLIREHAAFATSQGNVIVSGIGGAIGNTVLNNSKNYLVEIEAEGATRIEYDANVFELNSQEV